jgi:aspartate kinase
MIVMKFGGTSLKDAEHMDKVLDITEAVLKRSPVIVASAMADVTDFLQRIALLSEQGKEREAKQLLKDLKKRHDTEVNKLLTAENKELCLQTLAEYFNSLESIAKGLCLLKERTLRSNDAILSFGERLSTLLLFHRAIERDLNAILLDSRDLIITDNNFTNAYPIFELTNEKIRNAIKQKADTVYITQGFISSTKDGITTTLGRGGSDYSATIIGAALAAEEVQIWTDVDGIMTSDPRVVSKAFTISAITYKEAAELAYFGAKVIHPSTIQPAVNLNIPVVVKNTENIHAAGTKITSRIIERGLKAIAFKESITLVNITSSRMLLAHGFLRRIFEVFEKYKTSVDLVSTSEVSVSVTIDQTDRISEISEELTDIASVLVEKDMSIICLVGQELWKDSIFVSQVFGSLSDVPIRMITLGSSDTNLSLVIPAQFSKEAVQKLHRHFFKE